MPGCSNALYPQRCRILSPDWPECADPLSTPPSLTIGWVAMLILKELAYTSWNSMSCFWFKNI